MDTKVKNMFGTGTTEDRTEQLAPRPTKASSRSAHLYDIMSSLGGDATLTEIWRMVPASDLKTRPKNKQQLRDWLSQSSTSKGYLVRVRRDYYRLAKLEEYDAIIARNKNTARRYKAKKDRQEARAAAKAAAKAAASNPVVEQSVVKQPVVEQPVVQQPVVQQPNTSSQFAREYLGALLGTSCAIVLFYVILKLTV